jgi:stringent starvation protein B
VTSNRPYLIRALYEWLVDNDLTPHLLVDATMDNVEVPTQFVEDGRIVLNINPTAVMNLQLDNDFISFNARFGGRETSVFIPPQAVLGIYARENGRGMLFPDDVEDAVDGSGNDPDDNDPAPVPPKGKPSLKVVK